MTIRNDGIVDTPFLPSVRPIVPSYTIFFPPPLTSSNNEWTHSDVLNSFDLWDDKICVEAKLFGVKNRPTEWSTLYNLRSIITASFSSFWSSSKDSHHVPSSPRPRPPHDDYNDDHGDDDGNGGEDES